MSLDECVHLGRKLEDRTTCVLLCDRFPDCVRPSPLCEALDAVSACGDPIDALGTVTVRQDGARP
jgi:hypothetical protein